jgi:hypothetical protein
LRGFFASWILYPLSSILYPLCGRIEDRGYRVEKDLENSLVYKINYFTFVSSLVKKKGNEQMDIDTVCSTGRIEALRPNGDQRQDL